MKRVLAHVVGPIVWLIVYGVFVTVGVLFWDMNSDDYFAMALVTYMASGMGAFVAVAVARRIDMTLNTSVAYLIVGCFALLWIGGSIVVAPDLEMAKLRAVSLIAGLLGILSMWRMR